MKIKLPYLFRTGLLIVLLGFPIYSEPANFVFSFFPEANFDASIKSLLLQKNQVFKERYFIELGLGVDFALFSINDRLFHKWEYHQLTGMGRQDGVIIFDPRDASYHATAWFEYRLDNFDIQAGLEHPCYHEIDRHNKPPAYWNKIFAGIQSKRPFHHPGNLNLQSFNDRLSWQARWGYFVGNNPEKNNSICAESITYTNELTLAFNYTAYVWKNMAIMVSGQSLLGGMKDGAYWSQVFGASVELHRKKFTGDFFINYNLDDVMWMLSRDRLLEVGIRIRK